MSNTRTTLNIVGMSHFRGPLGDALRHDLHVCMERLDDGTAVATLRPGNAFTAMIERAALCVDQLLLLWGQPCTPEQYIAAWRRLITDHQPATLQAWLLANEVSTTLDLPALDAPHRPWLSPAFAPARQRLFGERAQGRRSALLRDAAALRDAIEVVRGLTAYDLIPPPLSATLTVQPRQRAVLALAA